MSNKTPQEKNTITRQKDFSEVLKQIQQSRQRVFSLINTALIDLYWHIGKTISHKVQTEKWGKGVVRELAHYIAQQDPDTKGFSDKNLWRMKQFYETYCDDEKLLSLAIELPWSHNLAIFSRCKTSEERAFYLALSAKEKFTFRELDRQISACLYERTIASPTKLSTALRELQPNCDRRPVHKKNWQGETGK